MLNKKEITRYIRQLSLPGIGKTGQAKLKHSKVLVVGAGGLGCPVLLYLSAAGVGTLGIVDFDKIELSNLQRQVLYSDEDIGKLKTEVAALKLQKQNPHMELETFNHRLNNNNALKVIRNFDLVIDCTDNFSTRYLINDACVILNKPFIYGSVYRFEGQLSVFNFREKDGSYGPTYRCIFPEAPTYGSTSDCASMGVFGVLPGIIGTMQANEAIKIITGTGEPLSGKLLVLNATNMTFTTIKIPHNSDSIKNVPHNEQELLIKNYDTYCCELK